MVSNPRKFAPTQHDIAHALGVSQSTVALALNSRQQHKLLPDTVAKVQAKATEMGYRPQRFAQMLRNRRSRVIGLVVQSGAHADSNDRIRLVANRLHNRGYRVVAVDLDWFGGDMHDVENYLLDASVEGIMLCQTDQRVDPEWTATFTDRGIPILNFLGAASPDLPDVRPAMANAFYHLTRHVLLAGSRRPALLPGPASRTLPSADWMITAAETGFRRAIETVGFTLDEPWVIRPTRIRTDSAHEFARQTLREMAASGAMPDAFVCLTDELALGALAALAERDARVPDSVRVSGFDDTPSARYANPSLTSVRWPNAPMAERAAEAIVAGVEKRPLPEMVGGFPCEVVVRRSTCSEADAKRLAGEGFFGADPDGTILENWAPSAPPRQLDLLNL